MLQMRLSTCYETAPRDGELSADELKKNLYSI